MALQQRWLAEDADDAALLDALRADLLHTRRGPEGSVDACAVWREFRPGLFGEAELAPGVSLDWSADPDVQRLDQLMGHIAAAMPLLRDPPTDIGDTYSLHDLRRSAAEVADRCRELARRVRHTEGPWPPS